MTLHNQRVVVIGGSAGIGLATAIEAGKQGASIVIAGRSAEKLEQAKKAIPVESVEAFQLDNQKEENVQAFFEKVGAFDPLFTPGASYTRGPITIDTRKPRLKGNSGRSILLPSMRYRIFPRTAPSC
jgi:NAD(P)-dependent dehydrogenase (short-subunit alcohol dehydrogenase family)